MYLEDHIRETKQLFAHWRAKKLTVSERIPDALLERVAALSRSGVAHVALSRALSICYGPIDKALELFPQANRSTLEALRHKEESEERRADLQPSQALRRESHEARQESGTLVQAQAVQAQENPERQKSATKAPASRKKRASAASIVTAGASPMQAGPQNCAIIQVIDADCVHRIREHRAVLNGDAKPQHPTRNGLWGEMMSSHGTRLTLFEHVPLEVLQAMVGAFLQADKEVAHATSQRN